jgi:hypothetical protein
MGRGGKRLGASRKTGTEKQATTARQELASVATKQCISPLELMLKRMRHYNSAVDRELAKGDNADQAVRRRALRAANEAAKDAAPHLHPRLSAIEHSGKDGGSADLFREMLERIAKSKLADGLLRGIR